MTSIDLKLVHIYKQGLRVSKWRLARNVECERMVKFSTRQRLDEDVGNPLRIVQRIYRLN